MSFYISFVGSWPLASVDVFGCVGVRGYGDSGQCAVIRTAGAIACRAAEEQGAVVDSWRLASAGACFVIHDLSFVAYIIALFEFPIVLDSWRLASAGVCAGVCVGD
jgi:hypothetical protein